MTADTRGDALIVVDAISDFQHEHGAELADAFREASPALEAALEEARDAGVPVVYVEDARGHWDGDRSALIERALAGLAGDAVERVVPRAGDLLLFKPRYSAFDATPLALVLDELGIERIILAGAATEMCVAQTAIHAREHGLKVTVLRDACADIDRDAAEIALEYLVRVTGSFVERAPA